MGTVTGAAARDRPRRGGRRHRSVSAEGRSRSLLAGATTLVFLAGCGGASAASKADDLLAKGLKAQAAGNIATATNDYNQALAIDPRNKFALYDLGLIDQLAGRTASAETHYRAVLAIDPNFSRALFNLAIIRSPSAASEAVSLYRQVLALDPTDAGAHLNLGLLLRQLGQGPAGDAEVAKAVSLDPSLASAANQPTSTTTIPTTTSPASPKTTLRK